VSGRCLPAAQVYAIRQALAKAVVAYYQKFVDEASKKEVKVRAPRAHSGGSARRIFVRAAPICAAADAPPLARGMPRCFGSRSRGAGGAPAAARRAVVPHPPCPPLLHGPRQSQDILLAYDRTLLVADPRHREAKKFGGNARGKVQKSYR